MRRAPLFALLLVGCTRSRHDASAPTPPGEAPDAGRALPPLADPEGRVHSLALGDGEEAHVAVPLGATTPRPVVIGVHGAGDKPEWSCAEWSFTTGGGAFVVCPHGSVDPRWKGTRVWPSGHAIAEASARAIDALRARYGDHVAPGPFVYGAWSQGATLAGPAIARAAELGLPIEAAVLVEIGHTPVDARATAASLRGAGVHRLVVSCSSLACRDFGQRMRSVAGAAGPSLHVVDVGLRGHWFDEPVFRALAAEWPWLTEDDPRWASMPDRSEEAG
jgi:hypothetical protein